MTVYFGMLDGLLAAEGLPEEYQNRCQDILCNDCGRKGLSRFHWLYHKCPACGLYNTRVIKTEAPNCSMSADEDVDEDEVEPPPAAISFWRLFNFADGLGWALMDAGTVAAAAHDAAFIVYLH
ncbi:hypothetical protein VPH35_137879 [Triticum aestivum]